MKVACFSVAAMDYFPQQDQYFAGGNALNQSIRFAAQGISCAFIGALGNDQHGQRILALLNKHQVNVDLAELKHGSTATNRIVNDDLGERFGEPDAWSGGVFENYQISQNTWQKLAEFDVWTTHVSCPNFQQTLKRKTQQFLCVDFLHLPDYQVLVANIEKVDIAYVGGDESMIETLENLANATQTLIVLTLGAKGSMAFHKGNRYTQAALPTLVVDTTGCGDAFQSAFTLTILQSKDVSKALLAGAEMGRIATTHFGGNSW